MTGLLYLALHHMRFHWLRSLTLVLVLAVLVTIPLLAEVLTRAAETRMMARAQATPLIYGASGAPLELTLAAAYFRGDVARPVSMQDYDWLIGSRLADLAPIHLAGTARGHPVIGTDYDYFRLRGLTAAAGRLPAGLGEVAVGAQTAEALGLTTGDEIASDVQQVFNLSGAYPVGMRVSGILASTGTPDDRAIFTDLKTGWIVSGLGHGHEALTEQTSATLLLKDQDVPTANASLPTYQTIASDQLAAFHFHGDPDSFPISAVLVFPPDEKSSALLRGRVGELDSPVQILRTTEPIAGLMNNVLQVKSVLQGVMLAVSAAALLAIALVIWLSAQMRRREFEIARRLGAGPGLPTALVVTEILIMAAAALLIALAAVSLGTAFEDRMVEFWMRRN